MRKMSEQHVPFSDTASEAGVAAKRRLKPPISLLRRLRRISYWAIHSGLAEKIARAIVPLDRRRGLHLQGWLAGIAQRHADHTDFWAEAARRYPAYPVFARNELHAALRAGRVAESEAGFSTLVRNRATDWSDSRFVIGLTFVDLREGNEDRLRQRIRCFLGSLRGKADYRIAALRLSRLIFARFPHQARSSTNSESLRRRFLIMMERASIRREPRDLLVRVAVCEARLEQTTPLCLLDTDVSVVQCRAFVSLVRERLASRRPFSFVRAGDGEAACLPYEPRLASHARADARDRERIWWGRPLTETQRSRIAPAAAKAIWDADCIGIPTLPRFLRELRLNKPDTLERSLTGRGLRSLLYCTERFSELRSRELPDPVFTSCHLHQELAIWNCYDELLQGVRDVVLISSHPHLADCIRDRFDMSIAASLVVPPDRVSGPLMRDTAPAVQSLPEMLDSVIEKMGDLPRGRLVLVGAGYPGKVLVDVARQRGGIALDLGSIFDYWLGLKTRSYLDLDSG
jgi:hypothetical protein